MKAYTYKAKFSEEWLEQNPNDRDREVVGRVKSGDDRYIMAKKIGAKTFQSYAKAFIILSDEKYEEEDAEAKKG